MSSQRAEDTYRRRSTLAVIVGSARPGRAGPAVASWLLGHARSRPDLHVDHIDLAAVDLPFLDEPCPAATGRYEREHTQRWSARIAAVDAVAIVTPEYNGSFPAPLKNAVDYLYAEWAGKPVGLIGYGMGSGGARAVEMLEQVLTALGMVPAPISVTVDLRRYLVESELRSDRELDDRASAVLDHLAVGSLRERAA